MSVDDDDTGAVSTVQYSPLRIVEQWAPYSPLRIVEQWAPYRPLRIVEQTPVCGWGLSEQTPSQSAAKLGVRTYSTDMDTVWLYSWWIAG